MPITPSTTRRRFTAVVCALAMATAGGGLLSGTAMATEQPAPAPATASTVNIADTHATPETKDLFAKLRDNGGNTLFGHQHAVDYAISTPEQNKGTNSDVYALTGKYPAMWGMDTLSFYGYEGPGSQDASIDENITKMADEVRQADSIGAIVTLSSHWYNPATGGNFNDTTRAADRLLPGGDLQPKLNEYLDAVARFAQESKRADGTLIPIIYRPLHESNGAWFWWGAGHATDAERIALYRYIVDYLRDTKNVHNLLFAYSPNGTFNGDEQRYLAAYPGDEYVDVLGYDLYDNDSADTVAWAKGAVTDLAMIVRKARATGKIPAMTEFGPLGNKGVTGNVTDPEWFTHVFDTIKADPEARGIAYMLTWANFGTDNAFVPWEGNALADDFATFAKRPGLVLASGEANDFSGSYEAVPYTPVVHFANPVSRTRIEQQTTDIYAKVDGDATVSKAWFTVGDDGTQYAMAEDANGYLKTTWDVPAELRTNRLVTLKLHVVTDQGELTDAVDVILGSRPTSAPNVIDNFDSYVDDDELRTSYAVNSGATDMLSLVDGGANGKALRMSYDFSTTNYVGVTFGSLPVTDWSRYDELAFDLTSDGSGQKMVVQVVADGIYFEAYPSLEQSGRRTVTLTADEFVPAAWDTAHAGEKLDAACLAKVTGFSLYINDNGGDTPRNGAIVIDNIHLTNDADDQDNNGGDDGDKGEDGNGNTGNGNDGSETPQPQQPAEKPSGQPSDQPQQPSDQSSDKNQSNMQASDHQKQSGNKADLASTGAAVAAIAGIALMLLAGGWLALRASKRG